jgi:putative transcriptional regulator
VTKPLFALRLKELRQAAGLTQRQLADKAGMALGGLNKLEQAVNKPSWETVLALAQALGVDCLAFAEQPSASAAPQGRGRPRPLDVKPKRGPRRQRGKK